MTGVTEEVGGFEVGAVTAWVEENVKGLRPPFIWSRFTTGHSNLTFALDDSDGRRAVIRRPPLGQLQPKAHDMAREFRVISALWTTPIPVAEPYGFCPDTDITGAPFYVMAFVAGKALPNPGDMKTVPEDRRQAVSESHIDVLAELHLLDPDENGLGTLGSKEDYVGRQLRAWYRSWTSSAPDARFDDRRVHDLNSHLIQNKPPQGSVRVVHGDYGLHNCLLTDDGRIAAVLDWELATLGDPLADLAYCINRWSTQAATLRLTGYLSPEEMIERYRAKTGADVSGLDYYRTFSYWKSACIIHGVYTRYVRGQKSSDGVDLDAMRVRVELLLEDATSAAGGVA